LSDRVFDVSAVAFDLDGTLLDTIHDLASAVNALLAELGLPRVPKDQLRGMVGKGMANLVRRALAYSAGTTPEAIGGDELRDALGRYQEHYASRLGDETRPFPGMREGLERIRRKGFPLAVVTNKATRFVWPHLERAGIAGYFAIAVGGDDLPAKKPDPAQLVHAAALLKVPVARLLMVGDSGNDALAARAAGCPVLLLPYGYNEGLPVQSLDADGIVPSLAAVADRVRYVRPDSP
jgi:phosphoglycolate phosphatase